MSFLVGLLWTLCIGPGSNEGKEFSRRHGAWEDNQYLLHRVCFGGNYCLRGPWGPHYSKSSVTTPWWWMLNFFWNSSWQSKFCLVQFSLMIWAQASPAASTVRYFATNIIYFKKKSKTFLQLESKSYFFIKNRISTTFYICQNIKNNHKTNQNLFSWTFHTVLASWISGDHGWRSYSQHGDFVLILLARIINQHSSGKGRNSCCGGAWRFMIVQGLPERDI